ncbi:DUF3274 domain-containing protein [Massilia sp. TS11]|uniref:T6SS effector phospholipase Tle3 domain-containing protein n=1 Tax=Massilia sp. TS11 TaxID=2908003 RepID=UPI001EDB7537|nr:DUF3274 domain-containing protein [Massilia sp. TS11]MCG2582747.1 DUF3274 domain-containing protein [Massilia sp. TS11]
MSDELSTIARVRPDMTVTQWLPAHYVRTTVDPATSESTPVLEVPLLMPGTVIFVHGVNSDGEWYRETELQICAGLNHRLGRTSLEERGFNKDTNSYATRASGGRRARSPVIPFYWGYKLQPGDESKYPGIYHDSNGAWGGGPFQNGTNNLLQFWQAGFKRSVMRGLIDLESLNPDITRQLQDAPPRAYFVHAAKRLATLIDTIREDFPAEPVNVVAHSQGNMITLCAVLFMKRRAPDTLILNSAPYAFDAKITDWLAATNGWSDVQSGSARVKTFEAVALKVAAARDEYRADAPSAPPPETDSPGARAVFVQRPPKAAGWEADIGSSPVGPKRVPWFEDERFARSGNRGKVFVNFCPHDRVIGISAAEGIGWRGIPEDLISERRSRFENVYQRVFARNSGKEGVPAVGEKSGYWFGYFYTQRNVPEDVTTEYGSKLVTSDGPPVQTRNDYLRTYDGKHAKRFWNVLPDKLLGLFGVQGVPKETERVWINAPCVPEPAALGDNFDEGLGMFDGSDGDEEQRKEFATFSENYVDDHAVANSGHRNPAATPSERERKQARLAELGKRRVPKTNHSQILSYGGKAGQTRLVENVIAYDLTVGQGYAFGDERYWEYLIRLADWKLSDPYYATGALPAPGPYPSGLDPRTVAPSVVF